MLEGRAAGPVRAASLLTLLELDPSGAVDHALQAVGDKHPEVRSAALRTLQLGAPDLAERVVAQLASDAAPGVRAQAIETLTALGRRSALVCLVQRLGEEPRARNRRRIVSALRALSGMRYGPNQRSWDRWLAAQPLDWTPSRVEAMPERKGRSEAQVGLPVLSDRIAFLIDFSGSLWQGKVGDRTRKELAVEDLSQALAALSREARFHLIPYTGSPLPFRDRLVTPDRRNVGKALDYLRRLSASGKGNVYDAIQLALQDPDVDTIVVYTDGSPTGGVRWNLDLMVELLLERHRTRKVAFDAVLIDPPGGNRKRWERLAAATGGQVVVR